MLAAITGTSVRHNDAHFIFRNMKRVDEFALYSKRSLRAGPNCQLVAVPFSHGGARLERRVRDVSDRVRLFKFFISGR